MTDEVAGFDRGAADEPRPDEPSFFQQVMMMWRAFMDSPLRNLLFGVCLGILALIVATAFGQVLLNRWNQPFYDAIERRNLPDFFRQLVVFAEIAGVLLVLNIAQGWLNRYLHIKLREGLVQSTVLLASFIGVLWAISEGFVFHYDGRSFAIPGYMVWAALIYAGVASALSWLLGRPLIKLNSDHYAREAEMRVALVQASQEIEAISAKGGEAAEKGRLMDNLAAVLLASRNIMTAAIRLQWFTAGYGWVTVVAPIVIASPVYFAGDLTFGGLMMAAAAFTQVHSSLRWFVDNIGAIADWRATLMRVAAFRLALVRMG